MIWTAVLRGGAVASLALAVFELYDQFYREIRPNRIYSVDEAARLLRLERRSLVRLIRQGTIPGMKVSGHYRVLGQSLLDFLKR
ncbi:Magnetosome protein MamR [Rhodovastum atsumiense]|nr:helix-turn-helix domain-containing protein [Rhodovastum atsumiense]CAH2598665.1 Magnetosome protein MamR [Rhodovastum atsumiense]